MQNVLRSSYFAYHMVKGPAIAPASRAVNDSNIIVEELPFIVLLSLLL